MLEYKTRAAGDVTILDLQGRISVAEAIAFGPGSGTVLAEVIRDLANKGHRKILLNLKGVPYMDSSGMGDLVRSLTSLRRMGGELKLMNPTTALLELLCITHLDKVFAIERDEASAVQSFAHRAAVS